MIDDILEAETVAQMVHADDHADDHQVPVDDSGVGEPQYEVGPLFPEDLIPAIPVQEVPAQEIPWFLGVGLNHNHAQTNLKFSHSHTPIAAGLWP